MNATIKMMMTVLLCVNHVVSIHVYQCNNRSIHNTLLW